MVIAVSNLKVNNQPATQVVRIISPFPIINWEYSLVPRVQVDSHTGVIDSTYETLPEGFEVRVGTSAKNLGTSSFVGNLAQTGFIINSTKAWRYRGAALKRGSVYYGQIRITDSINNTSDWATFEFQYNSLPFITSSSISPVSPILSDSLLLSYSFVDADNDVESGSVIWWFLNGVHERQFDNQISIPPEQLSYRDVWMAQIFPSDGFEIGSPHLTPSVTIGAETSSADQLIILPPQPTYNDPLYAKYDFTSPNQKIDQSQIRWYVNGNLQTNSTTKFVRLELNTGDVVHFEVLPNDGTVAADTWVVSQSVTISEPLFVVKNLRINGQTEPLTSTTTPTVTWAVAGPNKIFTRFQVDIGTAAGSANVYSEIVSSNSALYIIPTGLLIDGRDYYISISAGDDSNFGQQTTVHIRTVGSNWLEKVNNATGWTVEWSCNVLSTAIVSQTSSSSSSSSSQGQSQTYQGVHVYDGTKYAEIRIYTDRVVIISGPTTLTYLSNNTEFAVYTVTGSLNNIKLYRNYQLVIDGTGTLLSPTSTKLLEFGAIGTSTDTLGQWLNLFYTTAGAFEPSNNSQYYGMAFAPFLEVDGSIDYISGENTDVYFATSDSVTGDSSRVFKLTDTILPTIAQPSRTASLSVNSIRTSNNGNFTYICHDNGVTVIRGRTIEQYYGDVEFNSGVDAIAAGWELTEDSANTSYIPTGIRIDTSKGGKHFFSQSLRGSPWFDKVNNTNGWSVSFALTVENVTDDNRVSNTDDPDGVGIYINDGTYQEIIQFFEQEIVFRNANVTISFPAANTTEYVLVGQGTVISLWAKSSGVFNKLGDARLSVAATDEANGGRPSITEDSNGNQHAVWHDDGNSDRNIYYSFGDILTGTIEWTSPVKIAYASSNPSIAIDGHGTIYVAYETLRSDSTDIGIVVKNIFGWSQPILLDAAQYQSVCPKLAIDSQNNVYLVWEDHRNINGAIMYRQRSFANGKWGVVNTLSLPTENASRPSICSLGQSVFFSYTVTSDSGLSDVFALSYDGTATTIKSQVSFGGVTADFSDIAAINNMVFVVWHDNKTGEYQIYGRTFTASLLTPLEVGKQLTVDLVPARFPSIGTRDGNDPHTNSAYVVFEVGGDVDPYYADGWSKTNTYVAALYYDNNFGGWMSSGQSVHHDGLTNISLEEIEISPLTFLNVETLGSSVAVGVDVLFITDDLRQSRRPRLAKTFSAMAHVVCEVDSGTSDDEYLSTDRTFTTIQDVVWSLDTSKTIYSFADIHLDRPISGQLNRKEIRFGDFSGSYGGSYVWGYLRFYPEAIDPFDARLILGGNRIVNAKSNDTGDGWIAGDGGLSFYFYENGQLAKFTQGLLGQGPISDVGFDRNNIMFLAAAGNIYISYDHLNFYQAFQTFLPSSVSSFAFDGDNNLWVATANGIYKINTYVDTSGLPRDGSSIPQPPPISSSTSQSSSSSSSAASQAGGNEIASNLTSGLTYYALVLTQNLLVWNTVTLIFEVAEPQHWQQYAIPLHELAISGTFAGNFPTAITTPGIYNTYIYQQMGSQPDYDSDQDHKLQFGEVDWDGTKEVGFVPPTNIGTGGGGGSNPTTISCEVNVAAGFVSFNTSCGLPSNNVRKIYVDSQNQVWAASDNGLILIRNNRISIFSADSTGIPSDDVRDIAIVNSAIRYVATSGGLARMIGTGFELITFGAPDWSDDPQALSWRNPNTLWVGAGGKLLQLLRDETFGTNTYLSFDSQSFANYATNVCTNSQRFTFDSLADASFLQVQVNDRIVQQGYRLGGNTLLFDSPLLDSDTVQIIVRNDIVEYATLQQNTAQELAYGPIFRQLVKFTINDGVINGLVTGDRQQIVSFDNQLHNLPYDKIVFDSTPPVGELDFVQQIDGSDVRLQITNYSDNLSGIKNMIVSNYPNLTSDGVTPLPWVPFQNDFSFNLGSDFGNVFTQFTFTDCTGRRLIAFNSNVYAGTAFPARIYAYNTVAQSWSLSTTIDARAGSAVEFMVVFKNSLYIGVSSQTGGTLYVSADGINFTTVVNYSGNCYSATIVNNVLYIGTDGINGGQLFSFDGLNNNLITDQLGAAIYALYGLNQSIYIGTGENGIIYRYDIPTATTFLLVNSGDTRITALGSALVNPANPTVSNPQPDNYLFAGTGVSGQVLKSINSGPFSTSFASIPSKVSQLKSDANGLMNSIVGNNIYRYDNRVWGAVYTNPSPVNDIYFDQNGFTLIYDGGIKRLNNINGTKSIYLSLQDVAGNSTRDPGSTGVGNLITTSINIDDLVGFVNQSRILELDEYGEQIFHYDGNDSFFSADKVTSEEGQYFSEVFNGTSDLVLWDIIYWDAVVPDGTDLTMSVRTATTSDGILTAAWAKTFTKDQFQGADISNLSGQYIQFLVTMTSTVRGVSPQLYKVNIRAQSRTSTHFFTTNFVLPSQILGGIITATTFVPVAADIVFGINTNNSTEFADYQIIQPDTIFTVDPTTSGTNLRVGIKLISPLQVSVVTDELDEYGPYTDVVWNNVIPFSFTNSGSSATYQFKVELFNDPDFSVSAATIYSGTLPTAFAFDGTIATSDGITLNTGQTTNVIVATKGNAAIRCNQFYFARVSAVNGGNVSFIDESHAFVANCNPNYVNIVIFQFTNPGTAHNFNFRAKFYSDPTRTQLVKSYVSALDATGWIVNNSVISTSGYHIGSFDTVTVDFAPPMGDLPNGTYYLVLDYYDGTNFNNITVSPSILINDQTEYSCGEYVNVPIVTDFAIQIQLANFTEQFGSTQRTRRTFPFNL